MTFAQGTLIAALMAVGVLLLAVSAYRVMNRKEPQPTIAEAAQAYVRQRKAVPLSAPLESILSDPDLFLVETEPHALLGKPAPDFRLVSAAGRAIRLSELIKEGPVVLVFYYGYYCNHCVAQLFSIDEDMARFRELDAQVLAVSADSVETTRERFEENGRGFRFGVLSDPRHEVAAQYDTYRPAEDDRPEQLLHGTFVIGRDGIVHWADVGDQPFLHNQTLLHELARLEGRLPPKGAGGRAR